MNDMLRRALRESIGLRHQLEMNLFGRDSELWEGEFKKFLRHETCWIPPDSGIALATTVIWRTIEMGTYENPRRDRYFPNHPGDRLRFRIGVNCSINDEAQRLLPGGHFCDATSEGTVKLAKVSGRQLGCEKSASYQEIVTRGLERGLELCNREVGPRLRDQYIDQTKNEWLLVAMERLSGFFFLVQNSHGQLWLRALTIEDISMGGFYPDQQWVFQHK
jgi:hypothetical protein